MTIYHVFIKNNCQRQLEMNRPHVILLNNIYGFHLINYSFQTHKQFLLCFPLDLYLEKDYQV